MPWIENKALNFLSVLSAAQSDSVCGLLKDLTRLLCYLGALWVVCNTNSDGRLSSHPFPGRRGRLGRSGSLYVCACVSVFVCVWEWKCLGMIVYESAQVSLCFCVFVGTSDWCKKMCVCVSESVCSLGNGGALVCTGMTGMVLTVLCSFHICSWLVCQDVAKELSDKEGRLNDVCVFNTLHVCVCECVCVCMYLMT